MVRNQSVTKIAEQIANLNKKKEMAISKIDEKISVLEKVIAKKQEELTKLKEEKSKFS